LPPVRSVTQFAGAERGSARILPRRRSPRAMKALLRADPTTRLGPPFGRCAHRQDRAAWLDVHLSVALRGSRHSVVKILDAARTQRGTDAGGPGEGVGRSAVRKQDFNAEEAGRRHEDTENRATSAAVPQGQLNRSPPIPRPRAARPSSTPSSTDAALGRAGLALRAEPSARRFARSDRLPGSVAGVSV